MRGADSASAEMTGGLAALWRGILYDKGALEEAGQLVPRLSFNEHLAFHDTARKQGLAGRLGKQEFSRLASEMVAIARRGLERLDPQDAPLLEPLAQVAASGRSPAHDVLEAWQKDPRPEAVMAHFTL